MSDKEDEYSTVRIPRELADEADELIGKKGFRSRAEIVKEALRRFLRYYKEQEEELKPSLEHFNLNPDGVIILDRELNSIVQVYFKPDRVVCERCGRRCRHVKFALSIPKVQEILREKGWKPRT